MGNASAFAALDKHIERVSALRTFTREAAPDVARAVDSEARRTIAAGVDPYGKALPKREDGGQPLATAGKALGVGAVGTTIVMRLRGHVARHHLGRAKGGIVRMLIPTRGIPSTMSRAIRRVLANRFREATRG